MRSRSLGEITPFVDQPLEIDDAVPIIAAEQQDRQRPHLAGLDQGQQLEHLVARAVAAGEHRHRPRPDQEVHLAQREIVKLEAQLRRDIGVGQLLVRQHDVEPDAGRTDIVGAAVGRFHEARPAARADHELLLAVLVAAAIARQPGQLPRHVVQPRLGLQPLGDRQLLVVGRRLDQRVGHVGRGHPRRPVEHEGRGDVRFAEQQLGLQQLELEADRPQILAQQELAVLERQLVGRAFGLRDRRHMLGGAGVDLGGWKDALGRVGPVVHPRRLAANRDSVTTLAVQPSRPPSRSGGCRTSPRPAPRTAAASRSAANKPRG